MLTNTGLTTTIDPAEAYYLDTMSIDGQLLTRSLTQYRYDAKTRQMILVPDLATDLGRHNDDYTKWTFTIRARREVRGRLQPSPRRTSPGASQRCMDAATFPTGPCQYYSNVYFRGGASYKGPYTAPHQKFTAVKVAGEQADDPHGQAVPRHAVLGRVPGQRARAPPGTPPTPRRIRTTRCRPGRT